MNHTDHQQEGQLVKYAGTIACFPNTISNQSFFVISNQEGKPNR